MTNETNGSNTGSGTEQESHLEKRMRTLEKFTLNSIWHTFDIVYGDIINHRELRCIVCDHQGARASFEILTDQCMFGGRQLERYRCPSCECIFGPQKYLDLPEHLVDLDYQMLYGQYEESDSTENEIRTFQSLSPQKGQLYLNWGCGAWSKTIPRLRQEGFDVWGYEPSAETGGECIAHSRGEISARFDGIFSNNVIEHFRDPIATFRDFKTILKDGGVMAHSSPCYDYSYAFTRFHTLFLTGRSVEVLAKRTGFEIIDSSRDGEYINYVFKPQ